MITGYEDLDVWKLADSLALKVYFLSKQFPKDERFGITSQLRRATLAIPTNIAEGSARRHSREFLQFCSISRGSLAETQYLLHFIRRLEWITSDQYGDIRKEYERVGQMLNSMITYLASDRVRKRRR